MSKCKNQDGFSLIELSIIMMVLGLFIAGFLYTYRITEEQRKIEATEYAIFTITDGLSKYLAENGHYPCAAPNNLDVNDPGYGDETDCTNTAVTVGTCDSGYCVASRNGYRIRSGMVPFKALNIGKEDVIDAYKNRFTYVVTEVQATPGYTEGAGAILLNDVSGSSTTIGGDDGVITAGGGKTILNTGSKQFEDHKTVLGDGCDPKATGGGGGGLGSGAGDSGSGDKDGGGSGSGGSGGAGAGSDGEDDGDGGSGSGCDVPDGTPVARSVDMLFFSHGKNGGGSFTAEGRSMGTECEDIEMDAENCDMDAEFVSDAFAHSDNATGTYDDKLVTDIWSWIYIWDTTSDDENSIYNRDIGNLGIGTKEPAEKLHVESGNIKVEDGDMQSVNICDENGDYCFDPDLLGGTGMQCGDDEFMYGISEGAPLCRKILGNGSGACVSANPLSYSFVSGFAVSGGVINQITCTDVTFGTSTTVTLN